MKLHAEIERVLAYFEVFNYPPTFSEINTFLSTSVSRSELTQKLQEMVKKKKIETSVLDEPRYSLITGSTNFEQIKKRSKISESKIRSVNFFFRLLSLFPFILFAGISGSLSMKNGRENDDIDVCIITSPGRMWTGRFVAVACAFLLGKKRSYKEKNPVDTICLNLFFDHADMMIPLQKRNEYVAHELLQLKPVLNRDSTYERFIYTNKWVKQLFPNVGIKKPKESRQVKVTPFDDLVDTILKLLQLRSITKRQTSELITDTQLWFYPQDFEKKIKKKFPDLRSHSK